MTAKGSENVGAEWMERIRAALKRDEHWRKDAAAAEKAFMAGEGGDYDGVPRFNILHSNVATIVPALYNSTPVPDVRAKQQSDIVAKIVAGILEESISAQIDDDVLDVEMEQATQDAYVAGRGIMRVSFEADEEVEHVTEPAVDEFGQPIYDDAGVLALEEIEYTSVKNERVVFKVVSWRDYVEGPTARFGDLPWCAYRHCLTDEALKEMGLESDETTASEEYPLATSEDDEDANTTTVWELWCKEDRTVHFLRESDGKHLRPVMDDPLGLKHFFPSPRPMQPIEVSSKRLPVCPYRIYEEQARELEKITRRIDKILDGIRIRGLVVGDASNLAELANADDNTLVPITDVESFAHTGGLDNAIVWWPFEKAVQVLNVLYAARDQTKQAIYEITGISDIVRGASAGGETATAQQIKTQWGSLRVQRLKRLVERLARDCFVLASEVIAAKFSRERLQEITGAEIPDEIMQALDEGISQCRVDIESDSTVRADLSRMKGEMEGFLNGTAQYFATMGPIVAQKPELGGPVMTLFQAFATQFNMGKQAQQALEDMGEIVQKGQQQPDGPSPEAQAQQAQMQAQQAEMQMKMQAEQQRGQMEMQRFQLDMEKTKADLQLKKQALDDARESKTIDAQLKQLEVQIKQQELELAQRKVVIAAIEAQQEIELEKDQKRGVLIGQGQ